MRTVWSWDRGMRSLNCAKKFRGGIRTMARGVLAVTLVVFCALPGFAETSGVSKPATLEIGMEKSIFLDLRDINVVDVFKFLAVQGNLNIVTSKNVQGRSTLLLRDVKIKDALDILVISNQLAYEIRGDIIYILTEEEYAVSHGKNFNDNKKISIRTLKTAKPSYVLAALQASQSSIGKIIIDEDTGTVVMMDIPEKLMQMNSVLDQVERNLETTVIKLQFAKVEDVVAQLKPQIDGKGVGTVMGDPRSSQIMISAYPERLGEALKLVQALDKQTKAVLVETRLLQLTLNPKFSLGIDWEKKLPVKQFRNLDFKTFLPSLTQASSFADYGQVSMGSVDTDSFSINIKAMKEIEDTKVLANPRVMILDRQEAKINIGDRLPYVITTSTGTGNNVSVSEDIRFIDVGIMLSVAAIINDAGYVTLKIRPEISSHTGDIITRGNPADSSTGNKIPIVNTTYVDSSIIVRDGVSVILGGLLRDEQTTHNQGIPYLMDIPILGNAFKSRSEQIKRTELVLLITPHIVTGAIDVLDKPIAIKGGSTGNTRGASFQESTLDMFKPQPVEKPAQEIVPQTAKSIGSPGALMGGDKDLFANIIPIKKGK